MSKTSQITLAKNLPFSSNFPPLYAPNPTHNIAGFFGEGAGKKPAEEHLLKLLAPGDYVQTVTELVMFNVPGELEVESIATSLGAPHLRTIWGVQSIEVIFSLLAYMSRSIPPPVAGEQGRIQVGANIRIGGRRYSFFLTEMPLAHFTSWTYTSGELPVGVSVEYIRRRAYTLELFSPLEVSKGEDIQISFTLKVVEQGRQTPQPVVFIIQPEVVANVGQTTP